MNPRVSVTGGIQPKILQRAMTTDFFERGLPARFIFAYPPFRQDRWSESTVSERLSAKVLELFNNLWQLQPNEENPRLLPLESAAKALYIEFYNQCGAFASEADENEEASWAKLSGYGARFALVGQLAHNPRAESVTAAIMEAACNLARWSGQESARIYATLGETAEQSGRRRLIEFITRRGGSVTTRDLVTNYWPLKNRTDAAKRALDDLAAAKFGKWEPVPTTERGGKPTSLFRLHIASASAEPPDLPRTGWGIADADEVRDQKTQPVPLPGQETFF